ncbi:MAG TPA: MarR family winged helix-turn-helix transcriptional regulator [Eoetvoesiella sp.]
MPHSSLPLNVMQQIGRTYRVLLSAFSANIGHPMPRWRVLLTLHEMGEITQKTLAAHLRMDPAALTRQLKSIEQLGWIERHSDAVDNRLTNVALTKAGAQEVRQALPLRAAFIERAFFGFSPVQMQTLSGLLETLEVRLRDEALSPVQEDATPKETGST